MSFCPICNNSYNISKSIDIQSIIDKEKDKQKGGKLNEEEIIKNIVNKNVIESKVLESIDLDKLMNNSNFKKLQNKEKEYVYNVIFHQQKEKEKKKSKLSIKEIESNRAYFQCTKCGNQELIKPQTLVYSNDIDKSNISINNSKYMIYDNTLPRTKNYTCENKKCITHKDSSKKEAVFYRTKDKYRLTYICVECKTQWLLV